MSKNCFVPGCNTGYGSLKNFNKKNGIKNPSLFRPQSEEMREKWQLLIRRADKVLEPKNVVCELHFKEEDIIREFITNIPDGTVFRQEREKPMLTPKATPSIFPNYPKYYANSSPSKRKAPKERNTTIPVKQKKVDENIGTEVKPLQNPEAPELIINSAEFVSGGDCCNNLSDSEKFDLKSLKLPTNYWSSCKMQDAICFTCWADDLSKITKRVVVYGSKDVKIYVAENEVCLTRLQKIESYNEIEDILKEVHQLFPCVGANDDESCCRSKYCPLYVVPHKVARLKSTLKLRCLFCKKFRQHLSRKNNLAKLKGNTKNEMKNVKGHLRNIVRKNKRLKLQVLQLRNKINNLRQQCSTVQEEAVSSAIKDLPETQQEAIQTCLRFAKTKNPKSMRYTTQWVYECLLLRIKSRKSYEHVRNHKILPLPCIDTLNRYIKRIRGAYGFQKNTFELLKKKMSCVSQEQRRGVLLIDEMKLSKTIAFNKQSLEVQGFTNLGKYTPLHQKNSKGNHALVIMFQPFQGKWVQTLGCFLSKDCASGSILHQILIEGVILTEKAGLYVDAIVSDGASWNRNMWQKFGINKENVSVEHPMDPLRKLWFISDFPHLIKNLRNFLIKHDETWTPDGVIKLKHWKALVDVDIPDGYNLKITKIQEHHIKPKYFQKMNVALAFQFFYVADAMEVFASTNFDLKDSESSRLFCAKIKKLIVSMNSRTPKDAMKIENEHHQIIKEFLNYLAKWEAESMANNYHFLSNSTVYGLQISLAAALEICQFLTHQCHFDYFMTARLNQDALERFFGLMRNACGCNDHPDSNLFIQMYRLVSCYSLVKPPKGSNITGKETLEVLLSIADIENREERKMQWEAQVDTIIDKCIDLDLLGSAMTTMDNHSYGKSSSSDYLMTYIAGYVGRKASKFITINKGSERVVCQSCLDSLQLSADESVPERHRLIEIRSHGKLWHPSGQLFQLISLLEETAMDIFLNTGINENTIFKITQKLQELTLPLIGCSQHQHTLTKKLICFYLVTRMHFVCKVENSKDKNARLQTKEKRKAAKLT